MRQDARRQMIVNQLMAKGSVTIEALAAEFQVSKMTVHRDLEDLEGAGLLRRIRGGATIEASANFESDYRYRTTLAAEEKARIATFAMRFTEPGQTVLIDDGSTTGSLARHLAGMRPLTVITNNMTVMQALAGQLGITLITLGGQYSERFNGFFGLLAEETLRGLRADVAFISSSSILGLSAYHQDQEVLQIKRLMIASATRKYLLVDHGKFGRSALYHLATLDRFDGIVTGSAPDAAVADALASSGIPLFVAGDHAPG